MGRSAQKVGAGTAVPHKVTRGAGRSARSWGAGAKSDNLLPRGAAPRIGQQRPRGGAPASLGAGATSPVKSPGARGGAPASVGAGATSPAQPPGVKGPLPLLKQRHLAGLRQVPQRTKLLEILHNRPRNPRAGNNLVHRDKFPLLGSLVQAVRRRVAAALERTER